MVNNNNQETLTTLNNLFDVKMLTTNLVLLFYFEIPSKSEGWNEISKYSCHHIKRMGASIGILCFVA